MKLLSNLSYLNSLSSEQRKRLILSLLERAKSEVYETLAPRYQSVVKDGWHSLDCGYTDNEKSELVLSFLRLLEQEVLASNKKDPHDKNCGSCITPDNVQIKIGKYEKSFKPWINEIISFIENKIFEKSFSIDDHTLKIEEEDIEAIVGEDYNNLNFNIEKAIYDIIKNYYENRGRTVRILEPKEDEEFCPGHGYEIYLDVPPKKLNEIISQFLDSVSPLGNRD